MIVYLPKRILKLHPVRKLHFKWLSYLRRKFTYVKLSKTVYICQSFDGGDSMFYKDIVFQRNTGKQQSRERNKGPKTLDD